MSATKVFMDYALNPNAYWAETHQRNAIKLRKLLGFGADDRGIKEHIRDIDALSRIRSRFDPLHVYIVNMGSSGSHWVESMLGLLPGFYNGGEIYLPEKVQAELASFSVADAARVVDSIYLAHLGRIESDFLRAIISNSAHIAKHERVSRHSRNKKVFLLIRNPVDIAISRTFRKNEYRKDVAPNIDDKDYLERNCVYIEKFATNIDLGDFSFILRYEDFERDPLTCLSALAKKIGIIASPSDLAVAVNKASKESVVGALRRGERPLNNFYSGEREDYSWARAYARARLLKVCRLLDY